MFSAIPPRELYDRIRRGDVSVLDVRNREEYEAWHVDGPDVTAANVPYMEFVSAQATGDPASLLPEELSEPVVAVCAVGESSGEVAGSLREAGVDAVNLEGGMEAWANLVVSHDLGEGVVQYERPSSGCLSYLVADGGEAAVVDPLAAAADRYADDAAERDLDLRYAVDTHVHADHVSGVRAVADLTGAKRVLPRGAAERGLDYDATLVTDGDPLPIGDRELVFQHAPGHTTELVVLDWGEDLLTADCLFLDGVGRPDLEAEDRARELAGRQYDTLQDVVFAHDDETRVLPGHVQATTRPGERGLARHLGGVRQRLGLADRDAFVERLTTALPPRPANYADIVAVNLGQREVEEGTLELERGPNNCAVSSA
jgi:glyoxylase-like metal-dependent hydrolase (beta-lactamase superfamily II)/rhodanese-related sulfurtransferase